MRFFPWKRKYTEGDQELLVMYRSSGDKAIVGELYTRYAHLVFGVCLKYFRDKELARDAVLQLFEKMFDVLKKNEPENFKNWMLFVARNHCVSELRKRNVADDRLENFSRDEIALVEETDDELLVKKEERLEKLEKAVMGLGEEQRKCIELFYFREKSYEEIAEITGYTDKQVKSYLQNGKRNLKLILEQTTEADHADRFRTDKKGK